MASFSSSFTGTDGDNITTLGFTDGTNLVINANHAKSVAAASFNIYRAGSASLVDQDISATIAVGSSANTTPFVAGRVTATGDCYYGYWSNGSWILYLRFGGTNTLLQSSPGTAPTTPSTIVLKLRDAKKSIEVNDVEVCSSTDNTITAAGSFGIGTQYADTGTSVYLDDYLAQDVVSPPTIDTDPASRAGNAGGTAAFSWVASSHGGTGLATQCQRNISGTWTDVGAAQGASGSYTTGTLTTGDDGAQFRVVATDSVGPATSATATLTVISTWPTLSALGELAFGEIEGEGAASGGYGSLSATQGANTVSATGQLALSGSASISQAGNTLAATGQLAIQGSSSTTQGDTAVSATGGGASPISGAASMTQGDNTCAATGALSIQGSGSTAQAGNTVAASGALSVQGAAATSQAANAVSATGQLAIQGSASINQAGNTASATGALAIAGASSTTQGANSVAATGQLPITGTATVAQGGNTVAGTAQISIAGSASTTQGANAVAAEGSGTAGNSGSADIGQAANTLAAAASLSIQASASIEQGGNTLSAVGAVAIIGTLAAQLDDTTVAASGQISISGSASGAQAPNTLVATGSASAVSLSEAELDAIVTAILDLDIPASAPAAPSYGSGVLSPELRAMIAYKFATRVVP